MKIVQWLIKREKLQRLHRWHQYCIYFDETVQYRIVYRHQIMTKSRAIWIQLKTGTILVPSISSHLIPISLIFIFSSKISFQNIMTHAICDILYVIWWIDLLSAMYKSSTSNAQRWICRFGKIFWAAVRLKSLYPHWVSRTVWTQNSQTHKWNPWKRYFIRV